MRKIVIVAAIAAFVVLGGLAVYVAGQIQLRPAHVATPPGRFEDRLTREHLREDLRFLVDTFARIHPDFADVVEDSSWGAAVAAAHAAFTRPMTRIEAYRVLAPLAGPIRDGHTSLRRPTEEWRRYRDAGGGMFPLLIRLDGARPVVERDLAAEGLARPGDTLISVDGVAAESLAAFALSTTSGEAAPIRRAYAEKGFFAALWSLGVVAPFEVVLSRDGTPVRATLDGLPYVEFMARSRVTTQPYAYRMLEDGVGYLAFNDMSTPAGPFKTFLKKTFTSIRDSAVTSLIIDLRENGGGDSQLGDLLQTYLAAQRLPSVARMDVRVTAEIKAYYRTLLPEGFRWVPLHRFVPILGRIEAAEPGSTFEFHPEPVQPVARKTPNPLRFDGDVYVLIGPRTYSSAVIFAAPLEHFGRARFVGARAGEPLVFYGENYVFDLPNSHLQAQVSHKAFRLVGAGEDRRWLEPDLDTGGDGRGALEAALREIRAARQ